MKLHAAPLIVVLFALIAAGAAISGSLQGGRPGNGLDIAWYLALGSLLVAAVAIFAGPASRVLTALAALGVVASFLTSWLT